jgi:hypothetical protein
MEGGRCAKEALWKWTLNRYAVFSVSEVSGKWRKCLAVNTDPRNVVAQSMVEAWWCW